MRFRPYTLALLAFAPVFAALPTPEDPVERRALGLSAEATEFELEELKGHRLVLLMFDLYCPACQKSVGNFNRLIEALRAEHGDVTVLGIGCGDTAFETQRFVQKFKLGVSAVPDRDRRLGARFDLRKTPTVMLLERVDGALHPIYQYSGYFGRDQVEALLQTLSEADS